MMAAHRHDAHTHFDISQLCQSVHSAFLKLQQACRNDAVQSVDALVLIAVRYAESAYVQHPEARPSAVLCPNSLQKLCIGTAAQCCNHCTHCSSHKQAWPCLH